MSAILDRTHYFCRRFDLRVPILLAPMAGACPPALSIAVAGAGALGAGGALLWTPPEIAAWAEQVRAGGCRAFQINLWVPDAPPRRDPAHEDRLRAFLGQWGPSVPASAGDARPVDFASQCDAALATGAPVVSSIMGLFPPAFVSRLKGAGVSWFATVTTLAEARAAAAAGADVIVAQGAEAGGHRGAFEADGAERRLVGLFALLPAVVDAVEVPVVATGGIADGRGIAAALALGASAVQVGTGFLRCPEASIEPAWASALATTAPEDTVVSRTFSGRPGRSLATAYVRAATAPGAPSPAPYPVQRGLTAGLRAAGRGAPETARMQAWAGQSAALARAEPAATMVERIWAEAKAIVS